MGKASPRAHIATPNPAQCRLRARVLSSGLRTQPKILATGWGSRDEARGQDGRRLGASILQQGWVGYGRTSQSADPSPWGP